jgi:predicted phage terminase large subunit-like protein
MTTLPTKIPKRDVRAELARRDLEWFVRWTFPNYEWSWHLREVCAELMRWAFGDTDNLILKMPPAHGKSELVSRRMMAWLLGQRGVSAMQVSYSADSAEGFGADVRGIMRDEPYTNLFGDLFRPWLPTKADHFRLSNGNKYFCEGVNGGLIGKHFTHGVIDDPIRTMEAAYSPTQRDALWQWFTGTWSNRRLTAKAKQLIVMHQWHDDDILGRLLKAQPDAWRVVNFEAIASTGGKHRRAGEALWPARFPLSFLEEQRQLNPSDFQAKYQGSPRRDGGGMFKRRDFRYAEKNGSPDLYKLGDLGWRNVQSARRFLTVDPAFSTKDSGDYTVIMAWAMFGEVLLLLDVMRDRFEGGDIPAQIAMMLNRHRAAEAWIEKIGAQTMLIQDALRKGLPVRELRPDKDKATRAAPMAAAMANGKVWFAPGPWQAELERELLEFGPEGASGAHDDQVDAFAYGERVRHEVAGWGVTRTALF